MMVKILFCSKCIHFACKVWADEIRHMSCSKKHFKFTQMENVRNEEQGNKPQRNAVIATHRYQIKNKSIKEFIQLLNRISEHNQVTLNWMSGHEYKRGNILTVKMAKVVVLKQIVKVHTNLKRQRFLMDIEDNSLCD